MRKMFSLIPLEYQIGINIGDAWLPSRTRPCFPSSRVAAQGCHACRGRLQLGGPPSRSKHRPRGNNWGPLAPDQNERDAIGFKWWFIKFVQMVVVMKFVQMVVVMKFVQIMVVKVYVWFKVRRHQQQTGTTVEVLWKQS